MQTARSVRPAFTLIEVLVVVAMTITSALLVGALGDTTGTLLLHFIRQADGG